MNSFRLASRSLFRKGRGNIIKIISLGLGLAVGLVLLTKVFFEYNYESFWPDASRIHMIVSDYYVGEGENRQANIGHSRLPGGVAPGMAAEIPLVEAATRYTNLNGAEKLHTPARPREVIDALVILADSCLHDVLPRPMLAGNAKKALSTPGTAIISRSLSEKLGGLAGGGGIGQSVEFENYPGRSITIEGVFEDVPENSDFRYDMAVSLSSILMFWSWDGSNYWDGNDRYVSFLKLHPGADPAEVVRLGSEVYHKRVPREVLKQHGVEINNRLVPLLSFHREDTAVRQAGLLMLLLAVALISTALLNYLIITLSTIIGRAREIAVYKCYGAEGGDIRRQVLAEAALHIALSLAVAALLVMAFVDVVQEILRTSLAALFSWQGIAIVAGVCAVLLVIATYVPSRLFANVPAASVFRISTRNRKAWKLALLGVQFACAGAFLAILVVIWGQYRMMMTSDPGYEYNKVVYANVAGTSQSERGVAIAALEAISGVEAVSTSADAFFDGASGDNVSLPDNENHTLFNIADLYESSAGYLEMMDVPVIEGHGFEYGVSVSTDILVNRDFAERITRHAGWSDGVIGKRVCITGHNDWEFTIVGVFENIRLGSIVSSDERPAALFYSDRYQNYIWVKLHEVNGETIAAVQNAIGGAMPDRQVRATAMKNTIAGLYNNERIERNSIVLCSVITLIIVLLGLVGYLRNEIARRSAEIAIRKINGAETSDVLRLLVSEILCMAVPALTAGSVVAYYVSLKWMSGFSKQIALTPWLYGASAVAVLAVILTVAVAVSYRISVQNPVDSLKKDE